MYNGKRHIMTVHVSCLLPWEKSETHIYTHTLELDVIARPVILAHKKLREGIHEFKITLD